MPSKSAAQARLMAAAAANPAFAAKVGVPVSVAQEWHAADTGRRDKLGKLSAVYGPAKRAV
jgi:hypothetical protein